MTLSRLLAAALVAVLAAALPAQDKPKPAVAAEDGFTPMFNGKDLTGWVNVNCHPDTFFVKDGEIITTGKPTGFLRTEKQYENFVLEMDWMHVNKKEVGNSGLFVWGDPLPAVGTGYTRGIEVQVLVNLEYKDKMGRVTATSHGDLFSIWGAKCVPDRPHPNGSQRCLPSEYRAKGGGEWNHYKVTANDGVIKLEVNGKEVSGVSNCNPRKGYLALESEDAECHFKNIKIKELPSTNPKPEEIAKVAEGHVSLFNGMDLKGWTTKDGAWKVSAGILKAVGKAELVNERTLGPFELVFDCKLPTKSEQACQVWVGEVAASLSASPKGRLGAGWVGKNGADIKNGPCDAIKDGAWNRVVVTQDGKWLTVRANGDEESRVKIELSALPATGSVKFKPVEGLEIMNVFIRELKEKK